jgi:hypothetical protein
MTALSRSCAEFSGAKKYELVSSFSIAITDGYPLRRILILLLRIRATPGLMNAEHRRIRATPGLVLRILQASPKDWMRRMNAEHRRIRASVCALLG